MCKSCSINDQVGFEIQRTGHMMSRRLEARVKAEGVDEVTLTHGWIIRFLYENRAKEIFQKDIEEEFGLRPPTATQLLKKMEQDGLIHREVTAEDGRLKRIVVSEKALQYKNVVIADIMNLEELLTKDISQEEMKVFFKVVEKMMENVS